MKFYRKYVGIGENIIFIGVDAICGLRIYLPQVREGLLYLVIMEAPGCEGLAY